MCQFFSSVHRLEILLENFRIVFKFSTHFKYTFMNELTNLFNNISQSENYIFFSCLFLLAEHLIFSAKFNESHSMRSEISRPSLLHRALNFPVISSFEKCPRVHETLKNTVYHIYACYVRRVVCVRLILWCGAMKTHKIFVYNI